jgi:hypothetical protein
MCFWFHNTPNGLTSRPKLSNMLHPIVHNGHLCQMQLRYTGKNALLDEISYPAPLCQSLPWRTCTQLSHAGGGTGNRQSLGKAMVESQWCSPVADIYAEPAFVAGGAVCSSRDG